MRNTLLSLVLLTILAGCAKNEIENTRISSDAIGFSTLNNKLTRAANVAGDNYRVYAKSTVTGETGWFINTIFAGKTEAGKTINTPTDNSMYYWPLATLASTPTVSFWAFAPTTFKSSSTTVNSTLNEDPTQCLLPITYTVPDDGQEDFTIATPLKQKKASDGTVIFQFNHVLSKVNVEAKLADELTSAGYSIEFTSADFGVAQNGGTIDATDDTQTWTPATTATAAAATYSSAKSYMFMPQPSVGVTVQLKDVKIMKSGATVFSGDMKIYVIGSGDVSGNSFDKGKSYNLTLTIDSNSHKDNDDPVFGTEITFSSSLTDWNSTNVVLPPPPTDNILYFKSDGTLGVGRWGLPNGPTTQNDVAFFKFGSVIGFRNNGDAWSNDKIAFNPSNLVVGTSADITGYGSNSTVLPAIPGYTSTDYAAYNNATDNDKWRYDISGSAYHTATNIAAGKGDPCKLAGLTVTQIQAGNIDNGRWRLPTQAEQCAFVGQSVNNDNYTAHWGNADQDGSRVSSPGGWFPKGLESSRTAFLPASGFRNAEGQPYGVGSSGRYWSNVPSTSGGSTIFRNGAVNPLSNNSYSFGYAVRCVAQ